MEFSRATLRLTLNKTDLYGLWRQLDINGSGVINFSEFTAAIFPNVDLDALAKSAESAGEIKLLRAQEEEDEDNDELGDRNKASSASQADNLQAQLKASKSMDSESSNPIQQETLNKLLASMNSLQTSMETITARMAATEAGQEVLLKRFGAVESLLLEKQQRPHHRRDSALEGDTASPATKGGPPLARRPTSPAAGIRPTSPTHASTDTRRHSRSHKSRKHAHGVADPLTS